MSAAHTHCQHLRRRADDLSDLARWCAHPERRTYELVGHKFFVSAPMCDLFLVWAQAPGGLSVLSAAALAAGRLREPDADPALEAQDGNASNASAETNCVARWPGWSGKKDAACAPSSEMVAMTRFDCMIGSSAGMRRLHSGAAPLQPAHGVRTTADRPAL